MPRNKEKAPKDTSFGKEAGVPGYFTTKKDSTRTNSAKAMSQWKRNRSDKKNPNSLDYGQSPYDKANHDLTASPSNSRLNSK